MLLLGQNNYTEKTMFIFYSWWSYIILIPGLIFASIAQLKITSTFNKYNLIESRTNWTASDLSRMLLEKNGCNVNVTMTGGHLSDHYNPKNKTLALSQTTYNSSSIGSLGVAAHEVGHAVQHNINYFPLKLRSFLVPVVNIGSRLAIPLVIIGVILEYLLATNSTVGGTLISIGIICYSLATVFALITLPVELDASRRAITMLRKYHVLDSDEIEGAKKVLNAAAMTYVASLFMSILYLLRFLIILSRFRKSND